jgi:hypothetical protein
MSVADWNPREMGLIPWMAARLAEVYPFLRNRERYGADAPGDLLRAGRVLPVLDGLDEIGVPGADEPAPAVVQARAIDEIVRAELPALVLTSRGKEYELAMARALHPIQATEVKLEAIRISDAERYIERESTPAQWAKWAPVLAHVRQNPQSPLAQALSKALMVVLAREVYAPHGMDPDKLTDQELFRDVAAIESRLLSGLVEHAFPTLPRRQQAGEWEGAKAKRWLTFLAARRGPERRQPDIAWWRLPDLAGRAERILAGVAGALFCGPAVGLGFGLVFNAWAGRTAGLVGGLAFGAAGAAVMGVIASRTRPTPSELQLGGSSKITAMARACAGIGVIAGLAGWVVAGAGFGAAAGAILGVPLGFAYGGVTKDATVREATPRRLLRQDIRVAVVFGSAYGFTTAWLGSLAGGPVFGLVFGIACAVAGGLLYGLPWVLALQGNAGVIAWVHLILARLILVPRGDLPWKVLDFLEAAHARGVLRRVGPVYQFRHESLRDALAETAGQTLTPQAPAPAPAPAPDG